MTIINNIKELLAKKKIIQLAIIYGSAAKGAINPKSDIDIAIAGQKSFSPQYLAKLNIDLSLELGHEIDIIDIRTKSGVILQQALCTGQVIINKSPELYALLIKKMWYNQQDMMPNTRMIWKRHQQLVLEQI